MDFALYAHNGCTFEKKKKGKYERTKLIASKRAMQLRPVVSQLFPLFAHLHI